MEFFDNEPSPRDNLAALFVEESLTSILSSLTVSGEQPCIRLKRRPSKEVVFIDNNSRALKANGEHSFKTYTWPGRTIAQTWKFTVILRILSLIYSAIQRDTVVTRRDIYYDDPAFFGSQTVVDNLIDDIAYTIGVDRGVMHVTAAAKGLVAGCLGVKTNSGIIYSPYSLHSEGVLIPRVEDIIDLDISVVDWILIVEKDAVFRRVVEQRLCVSVTVGKGIVITGKGYPDLNSRAFIHKMCKTPKSMFASTLSTPRIPKICALVDADPDGLNIMSVYKYGSLACAYDNALLNAPKLSWLGLRISTAVSRTAPFHALESKLDANGCENYIESEPKSNGAEPVFLPLTRRDRRMARSMMTKNPVFAEHGPEEEWRRELQVMLMLNVKAEIEAFYDGFESFKQWISRELEKQCSLHSP